MHRMLKFVSITMLLAAPCITDPQEPGRIEVQYWVEYQNSPDLPNGTAFHMTLLQLNFFNTELGNAVAAEWVAREMGLGQVDAHKFVARSLAMLAAIETDVAAQLARHACQFEGPDVNKKDKYAALQQTYDISKAIYDHYYDQTKAELGTDTGVLLQKWMDKEKLNIGHYEIDFEETDRLSGKDSTETLSRLCRMI